MELRTRLWSFVVLLWTVPFECHAAVQLYTLYRGRGFSNTNVGNSKTVYSESACAYYCVYSGCVAAQFNTATNLCIIMLQSYCKLAQLVPCSTCNTYVIQSVLNKNGGAALLLPLTTGNCYSVTDYFDTNSSVSLSTWNGVQGWSGYSSGFMANFLYFNNVPNVTVNNLNFYVTATSNSLLPLTLNVFNGSFTVSFVAYTNYYAGNSVPEMPILEFLGASANQICYSWRYVNNQNAIAMTSVPSCYYGYSFNTLVVSVGTTGLHYTGVYDSNAQTVTTFVNGNFLSVNSRAFPPQPSTIPITRLKIGGSELSNWYGNIYNGFLGYIGCINIYDRALNHNEVTNLYNFCASSTSQIIVT